MKKIFQITGLFTILICAMLSHAPVALGWGGRGHNAICMTAVHLVKEQNLKQFLQFRPHVMGHLCNIPDTYWRSLPASVAKSGGPAHFIDPEISGLALKDIPLDYKKLVADFEGKENKFKSGSLIRDFADEFGSVWWRVEQFFLSTVSRKKEFSEIIKPTNPREEQNETLGYNTEIFQMMLNMGLMGHFVGDASQPLHNTSDYDGYSVGHGGLHGYYEEVTVAEAGPDLEFKIFEAATKIKKAAWLDSKKTVLERMRDFSIEASNELPQIFKLDPVIKKSEIKKEKGMEIKSGAQRKDAASGWKAFKPVITKQMARSAVMLARLWDEMYIEIGKPDLSAYRWYKYPFTPDFIAPNYYEIKKETPTKKE